MKEFRKAHFALVLFLSISLLLPSCSGKIDQGEITFDISYPYNTDLSPAMTMVLPKEATLIFKDSKMLTIVKRGNIFKTEIYADEATKELEMRLDFGSDEFFTKLNTADQEKFRANLPKYSCTATETQDSLKGIWAKKYTIKYLEVDSLPEFESWFTEDMTLQNITWFSNYNEVVGLPLIYDIDQYGIRMHFEISGFKQREVKDEEFTRDKKLKEISYDEYDGKLNELFNILTE